LLHKFFSLDLISTKLLSPFRRIDEDSFEEFFVHVHQALVNLITLDQPEREITAQEFWKGGLARPSTLNRRITLKHRIQIYVAKVKPDPSSEEETVIAEGLREDGSLLNVNVTDDNCLVWGPRRARQGDVRAPQCKYQLKSSQHVTYGEEPTTFISLEGNDGVTEELKKAGTDKIFVYLTNKPFIETADEARRQKKKIPNYFYRSIVENPELIPDGVIIICKQNLELFLRDFKRRSVCYY